MARYHKHPAIDLVHQSIADNAPYELKFPFKHLNAAIEVLSKEFGHPEIERTFWSGGSAKRWVWDNFTVHQYEDQFGFLETFCGVNYTTPPTTTQVFR
jgi:hypothetical protein